MAQRTQVPKLESQEKDVRYNANSDNAKMGNAKRDASNPQDDPDFQEETKARVQKGPKHEHQLSREEKPTDSPIRNENVVKKGNVDSHHRHGGVGTTDSSKRVSRQSGGSDRSFETSPLHPHHQAKAGSKTGTVSSPLWERKGSSEGTHGLGSSTPGRSRLRSVTHGDETPDNNSPAVPKFGEWDENDPASAEGFTHIFDRVREEKHSGPAMITTESHTFYGQKPYGNDSKGCGCFPWGRK